MLKLMESGSVIVDKSNDNPGAIESSHETHHDNPRYVVDGVVHYCVSNIQNRPLIHPEDILGISDRKLDFALPASATRSTNFYIK